MKICEDCKYCGKKRNIGGPTNKVIYVYCEKFKWWTKNINACTWYYIHDNEIKECTICHITRPLNKFSYDHQNEEYVDTCKLCAQLKYYNSINTKDSFIKHTYHSIKSRAKNRHCEEIDFDYKWFYEWIYNNSNNFETLFNNWINSNYNKMLIPSIDRINPIKTYLKDNIQLMTWDENKKKASFDIILINANNPIYNPKGR